MGFAKRSILLVFTAAILAAPSSAWAIVYQVNRTIGAGSVTGFIETDGTLGALTQLDVVDWNLLLDDSSTTFTLLGPGSGANSQLGVVGTSFVATPTELTFDYSQGLGHYVLFQNPGLGSSINFWCHNDALGSCSGDASSETVATTQFGLRQNAPQVGVTTIAVVPEPGSVSLLGLGIAGLALGVRLRG
jgi:hypothetical protein